MHRTGRGVLGNRPASGTEIIQELGEEHQRTGKWIVYTSADSVFQIAAHEETIPLEELYAACKIARERSSSGKHAVGRVIARPFVGEPGSYVRTPNRHDFSLAAAAAELPLARPRRGSQGARCREDRRHLCGPGRRRVASDEVQRRGDPDARPRSSCASSTRAFIFTNLVETDMLWGHRNDPVNFHRCLQDFDRRLPDILDALQAGDLLVLTSDHGCDPTTPSTDHSREHAMLLAYVEGRNAAGQIHEGEFADVGATVNAWLGGKRRRAASRGAARALVSGSQFPPDDPLFVSWEYASQERLVTRNETYRRSSPGRVPRTSPSTPSARPGLRRWSKWAAARASSPHACATSSARRSSPRTYRREWRR